MQIAFIERRSEWREPCRLTYRVLAGIFDQFANPHDTALRADPIALSGASRRKQTPCSPPQGHGLGKTWKKRGAEYQFHKSQPNSPIKRIKRPRFLRNVCVALGNTGTPDDLPALTRAAADPDPLISEHARWAITKIQERHPHG